MPTGFKKNSTGQDLSEIFHPLQTGSTQAADTGFYANSENYAAATDLSDIFQNINDPPFWTIGDTDKATVVETLLSSGSTLYTFVFTDYTSSTTSPPVIGTASTSNTISFTTSVNADVWIVGGGAGGGSSNTNNSDEGGGAGGGGGSCKLNITIPSNSDCLINTGAGGAGGAVGNYGNNGSVGGDSSFTYNTIYTSSSFGGSGGGKNSDGFGGNGGSYSTDTNPSSTITDSGSGNAGGNGGEGATDGDEGPYYTPDTGTPDNLCSDLNWYFGGGGGGGSYYNQTSSSKGGRGGGGGGGNGGGANNNFEYCGPNGIYFDSSSKVGYPGTGGGGSGGNAQNHAGNAGGCGILIIQFTLQTVSSTQAADIGFYVNNENYAETTDLSKIFYPLSEIIDVDVPIVSFSWTIDDTDNATVVETLLPSGSTLYTFVFTDYTSSTTSPPVIGSASTSNTISFTTSLTSLYADVIIVGGGGGGGGNIAGGGGGGGATISMDINIPNNSNCDINTGGAGAVAGNDNGGYGGNSTFEVSGRTSRSFGGAGGGAGDPYTSSGLGGVGGIFTIDGGTDTGSTIGGGGGGGFYSGGWPTGAIGSSLLIPTGTPTNQCSDLYWYFGGGGGGGTLNFSTSNGGRGGGGGGDNGRGNAGVPYCGPNGIYFPNRTTGYPGTGGGGAGSYATSYAITPTSYEYVGRTAYTGGCGIVIIQITI